MTAHTHFATICVMWEASCMCSVVSTCGCTEYRNKNQVDISAQITKGLKERGRMIIQASRQQKDRAENKGKGGTKRVSRQKDQYNGCGISPSSCIKNVQMWGWLWCESLASAPTIPLIWIKVSCGIKEKRNLPINKSYYFVPYPEQRFCSQYEEISMNGHVQE